MVRKVAVTFLVYYLTGLVITIAVIALTYTGNCPITALCLSKNTRILNNLGSPNFWLSVVFWPLIVISSKF